MPNLQSLTAQRFEVFVLNAMRRGSKNHIAEADKKLAHALQVLSNPHEASEYLRHKYKREQKRAVMPRKWGKMTYCRMF